jgi:hypothetical protein
MTTDAGSGFDKQAGGRDAGDQRLEETRHLGQDAEQGPLEEESRHLIGEDALDEVRERKQAQDNVNDAF